MIVVRIPLIVALAVALLPRRRTLNIDEMRAILTAYRQLNEAIRQAIPVSRWPARAILRQANRHLTLEIVSLSALVDDGVIAVGELRI